MAQNKIKKSDVNSSTGNGNTFVFQDSPVINSPTGITKSDVGLGNVDNVSATSLRDRSTHTGTQLASTISDFDTAVINSLSNLQYTETLTSGFNFEFNLTIVDFTISNCTFYNPTGKIVSVYYNISDKIYVESNVDLLNHKMIIS
jgi:hypothetical protein